jgi:D-alanyl-lipoteichoic acid acyltransferase DltB (MBOAT superfamily)
MLFNSLQFLWFLPLVFAVWKLLSTRWKPVWLLAASYFFYMQCGVWFAGLLLLTTITDWYVALRIERAATPKIRRNWLLLSVLSNIGVLAGFSGTPDSGSAAAAITSATLLYLPGFRFTPSNR